MTQTKTYYVYVNSAMLLVEMENSTQPVGASTASATMTKMATKNIQRWKSVCQHMHQRVNVKPPPGLSDLLQYYLRTTATVLWYYKHQ